MQTKSHESYQRLLNGLPLGLMILSRDGKITFMNRFLAERFNSTARHAVGLGDWLHEAFPVWSLIKEISFYVLKIHSPCKRVQTELILLRFRALQEKTESFVLRFPLWTLPICF